MLWGCQRLPEFERGGLPDSGVNSTLDASPDASPAGWSAPDRRRHRRRFLKGSLASAPIILTLASRPALANHCSISGMMSGNLSKPHEVECQGLSPGYWKTHPEDWCGQFEPGPCNPLTGNQGMGTCSDYSVPSEEELTDALTNETLTQEQINAYKAELASNQGSEFNIVFGDSFTDNLTLMQAMWLSDHSVLAHSVAALLNACKFGVDAYGLSVDGVIQMVHDRLLSDPEGLKDDLVLLIRS